MIMNLKGGTFLVTYFRQTFAAYICFLENSFIRHYYTYIIVENIVCVQWMRNMLSSRIEYLWNKYTHSNLCISGTSSFTSNSLNYCRNNTCVHMSNILWIIMIGLRKSWTLESVIVENTLWEPACHVGRAWFDLH